MTKVEKELVARAKDDLSRIAFDLHEVWYRLDERLGWQRHGKDLMPNVIRVGRAESLVIDALLALMLTEEELRRLEPSLVEQALAHVMPEEVQS